MNLEKICNYQIWANNKIRDIIRELNEEKFIREIGPPFGSVKDLCVHIIIAIEYNVESFVKKIDVNTEELYETLKKLSKNELLAKWEEADEKLLEHVKQKAQKAIMFPNYISGGELLIEPEDFYMQYVMHTTYHRGQILSTIKSLGKGGRTTDYLFYLFYLKEQKG
ncbi:MAG: DinB family protein [Candidatus Methanofastidiosia archaeon]